MILAQRADPDPKRARILEGAMKVFLAYGYSRVTMDDIAREAGISRPALYLLFKNKAEIYRALGSAMLDASAATASEALAADQPFAERALAAIDGSFVAIMRKISESPHGNELFDMRNTLAGDVVAAWRSRLSDAFAAAIAAEAARNKADLAACGLSPQALADMLIDGLEGMKARITTPQQKLEGARHLIAVIALAVQRTAPG